MLAIPTDGKRLTLFKLEPVCCYSRYKWHHNLKPHTASKETAKAVQTTIVC
jgi:hypothetical protein